jgi:hypothetical protein
MKNVNSSHKRVLIMFGQKKQFPNLLLALKVKTNPKTTYINVIDSVR